jgi:hypothetical protein
MVVRTIPQPILDENGIQKTLDGKPLYTKSENKEVPITPTNVEYLGSDTWKIKGKDENKDNVEYEATTPSLVSFFDEEVINWAKSKSPNKTYKNTLIPVKNYKANNAPKAVVTPKKGGAPRPN